MASHEVFAEYPFSHYNYQVRLVGNDGMTTPYSRGNLLDWDVRDHVYWGLWWKRTEAPKWRSKTRMLIFWLGRSFTAETLPESRDGRREP